jgi:hypothetical protein
VRFSHLTRDSLCPMLDSDLTIFPWEAEQAIGIMLREKPPTYEQTDLL